MHHEIAIKFLKDQIKYLKSQIESSYDEVWTEKESDRRVEMEDQIESIEKTISVLELMK